MGVFQLRRQFKKLFAISTPEHQASKMSRTQIANNAFYIYFFVNWFITLVYDAGYGHM